MQTGMIGLGRMGANMARRLMKRRHMCVVYDHSPEKVEPLSLLGAVPSSSLGDMVAKLAPPKTVWLMLPAGEPTETTVMQLYFTSSSRRYNHRRRQLFLQRRRPPPPHAAGKRHQLCRCGNERRHLGFRARLLSHARRQLKHREATRSNLFCPSARARRYPKHARPQIRQGYC